MTWQPEIEELNRRRKMAEAMGGPDKVKRQHDGGRLTVRERVLKLVDKNSFHEVGAIAGRGEYDAKGDLVSLTPSNCVIAMARAMRSLASAPPKPRMRAMKCKKPETVISG